MGGNRGPVVKRDRGLTGSHVVWKGKPLTSSKKGSRAHRKLVWKGKPLTSSKKRDRGLRQPEVT